MYLRDTKYHMSTISLASTYTMRRVQCRWLARQCVEVTSNEDSSLIRELQWILLPVPMDHFFVTYIHSVNFL